MVRSLPYPAIEEGNFSFPEGNYEVTPEKPPENLTTSVILRHELRGARLVEDLIQEGKAKFACLLSVPKTGFRKLYIADSNEQKINWDLGIAGEPPMIRPVVLYVADDKLNYKLTAKDGVAEVWYNRKIDIPKGARLARGRYLRSSAAIQNLIRVRVNENMKLGSFFVTPNSNEGFYFYLEVASDIFEFIQNPQGESELRGSILVHAVSQCFNILKTSYDASGEEGSDEGREWEQYKNLVALSDWLVAQNMPHWSDENFDAVHIATQLYPIRIPSFTE